MTTAVPNITVLIPTYNEQEFINECLNSIAQGNYQLSKLEVLVIDGGSSDNTVQQVKLFMENHPWMRLLHNPKKTVPNALNIGTTEASHEILVRLDAHSVYDPSYIVNSVQILLEENCSSVGGIMHPIGKNKMGKAIANATTCIFGIGNAKYRYATEKQYVDTVWCGCWYKKDILEIGGFNEKLVRAQDYELNYRLRKHIGPIILDPSIRFQYYCRDSLFSLAKQYFGGGFWRFKTIASYPGSICMRNAAPLVLLAGLVLSFALVITGSLYGWLIPICYSLLVLIFSLSRAFKSGDWAQIFLLPIIFPIIHLSWAIGFVRSAWADLCRSLWFTARKLARHN